MFIRRTGPIPNRRAATILWWSGPGTAGLVAAAGAAILGAKVALVERHLMGGDCLNYGCVPSKALIRASRAAYAITEARAFGIEASPPTLEFADGRRRVRRAR